MCNACGFYCCASDAFDGCGCGCPVLECFMVRCELCGASSDPVQGCYECDPYEVDE